MAEPIIADPVIKVAITRPIDDGQRSAAILTAWGADVLLEPLLVVMPAVASELPSHGIQAFLLTSANGARALAGHLQSTKAIDPALWALPVLCVGDQTMRTALALGFRDVRSADGDVISLAALARETLDPAAGALLHAAGSVQAGNLAELLTGDGFDVRRTVLYETRKATAFSQDFLDAVDDKALHGILFYSPRTAATFATLAGQATITTACATMTAYCLSPAVAQALAACPFQAVRVAPQPTQDALFDLLKQDVPHLRSDMPVPDVAPSSLVPWTTQSAINHGDRSMSDRPTAPDAEASAKTPAGKDLPDGKPTDSKAPDQGKASPPAPAAADKGKASGQKDAKDESASVKKGPEKPAAKKSGGSGKLIGGGIAVVLVGSLAAYASLPWWVNAAPEQIQPTLKALLPPADHSRADALDAEMANVKGSLAALEGKISSLDGRVNAIEDHIQSMSGAAPQGTMADAGQTAETAAANPSAATGSGSTTANGNRPVAQLDDLQRRLNALEALLQGRHGEVADTLTSLQDEVTELKSSRASASALLDLSSRVAGVEDAVGKAVSRQDRALAFLLAVGQLRAAVEGGRGFDEELKTVAAMAPADLPVAEITTDFADFAGPGVLTLTALQQEFAALGTKVVRASALPDETADWWSRTVDRLLTVVTVRRIDGDAVGDGPAAVVSRAQALLETGALNEAVAELEMLDGAPADVIAPWLDQARARLAADRALSSLTGSALAAVAESQSPAASTPSGSAPTETGKEG